MRKLGEYKYLVNFYEVHETTSSIYIVLEYISGGELSQFLMVNKVFKEAVVRKVMQNLLLLVFYMQYKGVMHRDIKPNNLMLKDRTKIHNICLIDFGLSTFVNIDKYTYSFCGTPGYVAPEILRKR